VGKALEDGLEPDQLEEVSDPNARCMDSALHTAAWLVQRSEPSVRQSGHEMVSALLEELRVPHMADATNG
jgi:hypothetical protein